MYGNNYDIVALLKVWRIELTMIKEINTEVLKGRLITDAKGTLKGVITFIYL